MTDGALCGSGAGARLPCAQTSRDRREQHAASRGDWRTRVSDYVHGHARLAELQAGTGNHPPKFLLPGSAAPDDAGGLNATSTCARSDSIDREHHDTRGNLLTIKDERHTSANTIYTYDFLNRLKTVTQKQVLTPGPDVVTQYAYDVQDNLTSVTDPNGNVTTYGYDDFRRMQRQSSPVTGVTSYSYDAAGNLVSSTDANTATTTRVYDAINRMTSATSTRAGLATETVTWTFDAATAGNYGMGRVATMTDPTG